jgi:hypothetical protein
MKTRPAWIRLRAVLGSFALTLVVQGVTPDEEKAFLANYKKAIDAKDGAALKAVLSTDGADAAAIEFYGMLGSMSASAKVFSIDLVPLTKAEAADYAKKILKLGDQQYRSPVTPTKLLRVSLMEDGTMTSFALPIIESKGKLVVPVPVPVK